ncbi:MAG TPA: arginine--tRNA ligase [Clostridiaceae bacterium]|nr:arginine--tRNA ligase [Clostridiaceae bacterium]
MFDFRLAIAEMIVNQTELEISEISALIEIPPKEDMGDYAFPCFRLAKEFKKKPALIASEISEKINRTMPEWLEQTKVIGPYLNFYLNRGYYASLVLKTIFSELDDYGKSEIGQQRNVIVEYSSPNIAKPFHVGHAYTTILGQAIGNIYDALGFNTIRMNHLGDYGTQFGKLIIAWRLWGDEAALAKEPIAELTRVYVKFHSVLEDQPELEDQAREAFKRLENKEPAEVELWQKFRDYSLLEFNRLYDRLEINFDNYNGESFYSDLIPEVVEMLETKNLLQESRGAQVVDLEEFNLNPCIILKSDGTTIYASRDIAAILYRDRTYDYYKNIYVVGLPQTNHFQQVFAVLKKAGFAKADQNIHVGFGSVKFKDGDFSTRKGNIILLEDLLDQSVAKTKDIITKNNPDMSKPEIEQTAEAVGLAAVKYTYLKNGREHDIMFDWEEILDFEGDTAPYLMYTYARARSILQKANFNCVEFNNFDFTLLTEDDEFGLIKNMYQYPEVLIQAAEEFEPSIMLRKISQLARNFNRFYHNTPILKTEDINLRQARLALVFAVSVVIKNGLILAGIDPVERM